MPLRFTYILFFIPLLLLLSSPATSSPSFDSTIKSAISAISTLTSTISTFSNPISSVDRRLSSAVSDCLELLDLSTSQLSLVLSPSPSLGTADRPSDLMSYLSAALGNQGTCLDSIASTSSSLLLSLVNPGLSSVTNLVSQSLADAKGRIPTGSTPNRKLMSPSSFPKWVSHADRRRLMELPGAEDADLVVALDGSGDYLSVGDALDAAPEKSTDRFVIYVKSGVYYENVYVNKRKWNVMLVGDGMDETVISGSRNFVDGWTTFGSATFAVSGKGFIARDLTIENTAGPDKHQAVALRSDSDLSVFYRCAIRGYQDTLYAHGLRQFYRDCIITGTVDFIFGNAAAVIQNSEIIARLPLPAQKNTITAQGRQDPDQNTGLSLQFCNITADSDLASSLNQTYTYLGRPWKQFSRTMVMQSYIDDVIRPEGWLAWDGDFALGTLYYAEYMNYGAGSGVANRVNWPGYHAINSSADAANFTVAQFIDGDLWLPPTGVVYASEFTE